jgi:hypothetical protein
LLQPKIPYVIPIRPSFLKPICGENQLSTFLNFSVIFAPGRSISEQIASVKSGVILLTCANREKRISSTSPSPISVQHCSIHLLKQQTLWPKHEPANLQRFSTIRFVTQKHLRQKLTRCQLIEGQPNRKLKAKLKISKGRVLTLAIESRTMLLTVLVKLLHGQCSSRCLSVAATRFKITSSMLNASCSIAV